MTLHSEFREPALFGKRSAKEKSDFKSKLLKSHITGVLSCAEPVPPKEKRYISLLRPVAKDVYTPEIYYDHHLQSIKYAFDSARDFGSDYFLVFANMLVLNMQHWGSEGARPCSVYDTNCLEQAREESAIRAKTQNQPIMMALETRKNFHDQLRNEHGPYISPMRAVEHPFLSEVIFPRKKEFVDPRPPEYWYR